MIRRGRKSAAQTPAPKKEQVYGSSKNPVGSAASKTSASKIQLSESIVKTLEDKRNDFNDNHPTKKVSLATLKAVMRRGMGAYSKSHRPTITGGAPNSRQAWGFARVNKFLKKYAGQTVKAAYVQDDDLMAKGGSLYHLGGDMSKHLAPNGKPSNLTHEQWHLVRTPEFKAWFGDWENDPQNASKVVDENGEPLVVYHGTSDKLFYEFMPFAIDYYNGQAIKEYRGDRTNEEFDEYIKKYGLRKIPTRFWFSTKHLWGDKFLACFLNIRNMFITDEYEPKLPTDYNGFRVPNEDGIDYYSVSKSEQIKLADGTNTNFDANNPDIRYEEGGLIAPNGNKSNLNPEQYKLVRTPQFKAWFGDWENDPENASKVVDENGEPLVVYHGGSNFNYFDADKIGGTTDKGWYGFGFYFSPSKEISDLYGISKPYFISIKNIFNCNKDNPFYGQPKSVTEYYIDKGYDGSSKTFDVNKSGHEYCVFFKFPNNIKLADGSNTTFDAENPDIRYAEGGNLFSEEDGLYVIIKDVKEESKYKGAYKRIFDIIEEDVAFYNPYGTEHEEMKGNDFHIYITPRPEGDVIEKIKRLPKVELSEEKYNQGGLLDALKVGMANLKKNGIVLTDNDGGITLIAYNTGNQERQPSLYNKALIYSSVQPIKSASEIIQKFDFQDFEWFSESKIEEYKKTHLIIMNQNEVVYDSNVLAEGGDMGKEITCVNCGWHWNTNESDEYDKYVCHKCGFDNRTFYDSDPIGMMKKKIYNTNYKYGGMNKIQLPDTESSYDNLQPILAKQGYMLNKIMKPTKSVEEIADEFDVTKAFVEKQLSIGAEHEMEHTYSKEVARDTALHHLAEDPEYYIRLKDMEMRTEAEKLDGFYKRGGAFSRETTCEVLDKDGERQIDKESIENLTECLNDLPQTKSMHFDYEKNDYTPARKRLHRDIIYGFKKDLVCVDRDEPIAILMGGSPASGKSTFLKKYAPYLLKEEIFKVDADEIRAKLPEYRGYNATQTHLETKDIVTTLLSDRNIGIPCRFDVIYDGTMNNTKSYIPLINLLKKEGYKVFIVYIDRVQKDVIVKRALERYKKSGRFVPLEVIDDFFEKGKTALQQLKEEVDGYMIVDGSNSDYKIIERGGEELPQDRNYSKIGQPIKITTEDVVRELKKGGEIDADDPQIKQAMTHKAGAAGGLLVGNRHSEGGIKAINKSTGQPLEMEGGEVVITRDAVSDDTKREFEGEMLSNREILSRINESGGGVSFAEGGDIPNKCACMGKQYKFGGKMMRDNEIVENIMTSHRKLFGIKYPELKPSEVMGKIFGNSLNYKSGGEIYGEGGTLVLINKKIPTFNAFSKLNKNVNPQAMKMAYKQYLNKKYFINFEELPHMLQAALLMGNQKLVDSYINS